MSEIELILFTLLITFIASVVSFITGFGLSTIMISSLVMVLPVVPVVMLVGVIHWVHNLWKFLLYRNKVNRNIVIFFGIPALVMSYIGAVLFTHSTYDFLHRLLGLFLMVYVLIVFIRPSLRLKPSKETLIGGGLVTGFFAGLFGIRGVIRSTTLSSFDLPKKEYIATTGFIGLIVDSMRLATYWQQGSFVFDERWRIALLPLIIVSFLGALIGRYIVSFIPQKKFRSVVLAFIFIIGLKLFMWPA